MNDDLESFSEPTPEWLQKIIDETCNSIAKATFVDPMAKWRPMNDAPKDGTRILATDGKTIIVTRWGKLNHIPVQGWLFLEVPIDPEDYEQWNPTHWMTLPTPPTCSASGAEPTKNDRFSRFSDEPRASIPKNYKAPLDMRPTRVEIERLRDLAKTVVEANNSFWQEAGGYPDEDDPLDEAIKSLAKAVGEPPRP